jgi:trehalose 6-phosphate synthase
MAEGIWQGLQMPLDERRERWSAMMARLRRNDINAWREHFLAALNKAGAAR